jgi:predicted TIM-barrel fold metal-dependent hydrolase
MPGPAILDPTTIHRPLRPTSGPRPDASPTANAASRTPSDASTTTRTATASTAWPHTPIALEDYATAAQGLGVVRAVYMEVDIDPAQHVAEAEYVIDFCRRRVGPLVAAVGCGQPADDGFPAYLDRFRDRPQVKFHDNALRVYRLEV